MMQRQRHHRCVRKSMTKTKGSLRSQHSIIEMSKRNEKHMKERGNIGVIRGRKGASNDNTVYK